MIRLLLKLAGIFVLAYAAVHLGYAKLEKELLRRSCFDIAGRATPEPTTQGDGNKAAQDRVKRLAQGDQQPAAKSKEGAPILPPVLPTDGQVVDYENPDFQLIIRRNIFQLIQEEQPRITEEQPVAVQETAPEVPTALNLTLLGTVLGDEQGSRAIIIEEKKNEQKLYQVGDAVQGAMIESIERGKVILDVFGARETLMMKKREGGGPGLPSLPARISPPEPRPAPDLMEDEVDDIEVDEDLEEKQVQTTRRPPSIRPHRRINFRRNPIRSAAGRDDVGEEDTLEGQESTLSEEDLPPLD